MGCASSKRIEAAVDVYRPAPTGFAVFDINTIQEPWVMIDDTPSEHQEKPTHVPTPILEKLNKFESDAPHTWDEVSKALEDLKPALHESNPALKSVKSPPPSQPSPAPAPTPKKQPQASRKSLSFHTVDELDVKPSSKPVELRKTESMKTELKKPEFINPGPRTESEVYRSVKENIFILRDKLEREKEGKESKYESLISKRDPLSDYPDKCPPGGDDSVVLYTTTLGGVRRTYEDCNKVRTVLEGHRVVFDERDVALHGEFLNELKELVGEGANVPRMFVKGRYIGGAEEVVELNETGRLRKMLNWARVERGVGRQACEGCGGGRFVPCLECGGSCKVVIGDKKERCDKCNENGLVHCPACL